MERRRDVGALALSCAQTTVRDVGDSGQCLVLADVPVPAAPRTGAEPLLPWWLLSGAQLCGLPGTLCPAHLQTAPPFHLCQALAVLLQVGWKALLARPDGDGHPH